MTSLSRHFSTRLSLRVNFAICYLPNITVLVARRLLTRTVKLLFQSTRLVKLGEKDRKMAIRGENLKGKVASNNAAPLAACNDAPLLACDGPVVRNSVVFLRSPVQIPVLNRFGDMAGLDFF